MTLKVLVMGVAGCGKSTFGAALAAALDGRLIEGDDFHLPESQRKMRDGVALEDDDRWPWLDRLGVILAQADGPTVLSCSALKRVYRERLRAAVPGLKIVFLDITPDEARARVAGRAGHLFPASLVASQFATLESPVGEPDVLTVKAVQPPEAQVTTAALYLKTAQPTTSES